MVLANLFDHACQLNGRIGNLLNRHSQRSEPELQARDIPVIGGLHEQGLRVTWIRCNFCLVFSDSNDVSIQMLQGISQPRSLFKPCVERPASSAQPIVAAELLFVPFKGRQDVPDCDEEKVSVDLQGVVGIDGLSYVVDGYGRNFGPSFGLVHEIQVRFDSFQLPADRGAPESGRGVTPSEEMSLFAERKFHV